MSRLFVGEFQGLELSERAKDDKGSNSQILIQPPLLRMMGPGHVMIAKTRAFLWNQVFLGCNSAQVLKREHSVIVGDSGPLSADRSPAHPPPHLHSCQFSPDMLHTQRVSGLTHSQYKVSILDCALAEVLNRMTRPLF